jgi:hypothetical protein
MLSTVAKRTAGEFFAAVERALTEQPVPAAAAKPGVTAGPEAAAGPGTVSAAPAATGTGWAGAGAAPTGVGAVYAVPAAERAAGPVAAAMTAAFVAGGVIALGGVAVGYVMGRRSRR